MIHIPEENMNSFLEKIPKVLEEREKKRIDTIFGSAAYTKRKPGSQLVVQLPSHVARN